MPNETSKFVWQYQAAEGTSILIIASSDSFEFGEYNAETGKWSSPYVENNAEPSYVYSTRTPSLVDAETKYPLFSHTFLPVTFQFLAWFLGSPSDSNPVGGDTIDIVALETGKSVPMTIRHQLDGGTAPQNKNAIDCYCVGCTIKMEEGKKMLVEPTFIFGALTDIGTYDNLTSGIKSAGELTGPYNGNPDVTWNVTSLTGVWRADVILEKEFEMVTSDDGATQTPYQGLIKPVKILLSAVLKQNTSWDDYVSRTARTLTITVKKYDDVSYGTLTFTNARVISVKETGHYNKGHYGATMALIAEKVEGLTDFFTEGGADFADHWKISL